MDLNTLGERIIRRYHGDPRFGRVAQQSLLLLGVEIPAEVVVGRNLRLGHGGRGLVVHSSTVIGNDVLLYHGVTIGRGDTHLVAPADGPVAGRVRIGDRVIIGAHAIILFRVGQEIAIGDDAVIGAGAVLTRSVGPGEVWGGIPRGACGAGGVSLIPCRAMSRTSQRLLGGVKQGINRLLLTQGWVPAPPAQLDDDFDPIWKRCQPYTMTTVERGFALHQAVRYVARNRVPGAFVECGVWRGGSSMIAALTANQVEWEPEFFLFDTFAGMTEPNAIDGPDAIAGWMKYQRVDHNAWCFAGEEEVRRNLLSTGIAEDRLTLVKGPVEETLPEPSLSQIAILRLDTDWYASTRHELDQLYPLLSPGAVLIIDDYGFWEGARRAVDEYFASVDMPPMLTRVDLTGRVAIKR